jgi:glycine C-acetyltransferase/8-amino-7-oxononanoate synthase
MVDEAHGTGALGPGGRGAVAEAGLEGEIDVVVGTLGKALGSYGAYVCASAEVIDLLVNSARPFIFSTALPPPSVGAAIAALGLLAAEPERVERLRANAELMRHELAAPGFELGESRTQILPIVVGEAAATMALCERALERGAFAQAIRPPTVPEGTSRLRLTVMATHREDELRRAAGAIAAAARELRLIGAPGAELQRAA